jgi:CRISPR-associated protein Csb1
MTHPSSLLREPRVKLVAGLRPLAGTRFQPTGFPDLGAATYPSPVDDSRLVLVESAQSMANRLEATLWDDKTQAPIDVVGGLPYVRIFDKNGEYLTSSRTESHRLASPYVKDARYNGTSGVELIRERFGLEKQHPIDHPRVQRGVFDLDPLCLIHGVFFADNLWHGQPKVARALTAFIEASGVQEAYSGGVKFDHVSNTGDKEESRTAKEGFGNVPFARTEFVAEAIEASFVLDVSQISRYALDQGEKELLLALALYEIRSLLDSGLRLRTACDLDVESLRGERPPGFDLPERSVIEDWIGDRLGAGAEPLNGIFG